VGEEGQCRFGPSSLAHPTSATQAHLRFLNHLSLRAALWIIKEFRGISSRRIYLSNVIDKF
jgi:hypothetical protein